MTDIPGFFWGCELQPGKPAEYFFEPWETLELYTVSYGETLVDPSGRSAVYVSSSSLLAEDQEWPSAPKIAICVLQAGKTESMSLESSFRDRVSFSVSGKNTVYLSGIISFDESDSEDDDTDENSYSDDSLIRTYPGEDEEDDNYDDSGKDSSSDDSSHAEILLHHNGPLLKHRRVSNPRIADAHSPSLDLDILQPRMKASIEELPDEIDDAKLSNENTTPRASSKKKKVDSTAGPSGSSSASKQDKPSKKQKTQENQAPTDQEKAQSKQSRHEKKNNSKRSGKR